MVNINPESYYTIVAGESSPFFIFVFLLAGWNVNGGFVMGWILPRDWQVDWQLSKTVNGIEEPLAERPQKNKSFYFILKQPPRLTESSLSACSSFLESVCSQSQEQQEWKYRVHPDPNISYVFV